MLEAVNPLLDTVGYFIAQGATDIADQGLDLGERLRSIEVRPEPHLLEALRQRGDGAREILAWQDYMKRRPVALA